MKELLNTGCTFSRTELLTDSVKVENYAAKLLLRDLEFAWILFLGLFLRKMQAGELKTVQLNTRIILRVLRDENW